MTSPDDTVRVPLLPCPFCGEQDHAVLRNTHTASFWVECDEETGGCGAEASGQYFDGPARKTRFSYDPEADPSDKLYARTVDELHPEYRESALSAIAAWNRRAAAGVPDEMKQWPIYGDEPIGPQEKRADYVTGWNACRAAMLTTPQPSEATQDDDWRSHGYTYVSKQATNCAQCGEYKHTPLRIDAMDGHVCLTCIDKKLSSLLGEFGYPDAQPLEQRARDEHIETLRGMIESRCYTMEGNAALQAGIDALSQPQVVVDEDEVIGGSLDMFTEYFVKNYPGPNTIISDPYWHAPRIFRAAKHALISALSREEG